MVKPTHSTTAAAPHTAAPDWQQIPFTVRCMQCGGELNGHTQPRCLHCGTHFRWDDILPLDDLRCEACGYRLFGLNDERCPECGDAFQWERTLRLARSRRHKLFEHMWQRDPLESLGRTWWQAVLQPRRFWAQYELSDTPKISPLALFVLLQCVVFAYGWQSVALIADPLMNALARWQDSALVYTYRWRLRYDQMVFLGMWYAGTGITLQTFVFTNLRFGITWRHILRVWAHAPVFAALCSGLWCLSEALLDATLLVDSTAVIFLGVPYDDSYALLGRGYLALGVIATWAYLWCGYHYYLRVPRGWGIAAMGLALGYFIARLAEIYSY